MRLKLTLKPISNTYISNEEDESSLLSTDDKLIDYEFTEETSSIFLLKIKLSEKLHCSSDCIDLWYQPFKKEDIVELEDLDSISSLSFTNSLYETVIYYRCVSYPITIILKANDQEIHVQALKVSIICSIRMLKNIIENQLLLNPNLSADSLKLFGVSIAKESNTKEIKLNTHKELENQMKIIDIIKDSNYSSDEYLSEDISLHLLLIIDRSKLTLSLEQSLEAKEKSEMGKDYSNGLNLIYLCNNYLCKKANKTFIQRIGYGKCNIIRETISTACPKCQSSLFVELENVGVVNAKWTFKGVLNIQKTIPFEGEGMTKQPNKLHLIPEWKLSKNYSQMLITVAPMKAISKSSLLSKNDTSVSFSDSINKILSKTQSFNEINQFRERATNKCESSREEKDTSALRNDSKLMHIISQKDNSDEHCGCGCYFLRGQHITCSIF